MKRSLIVSLGLILFLSCNNIATKNRSDKQLQSDFEKYVSTLDTISLPLEYNVLGKLPEISKNYDKTDFEKYKHVWTSKPLGVLYKNKNTIGIVDLSIGDWGFVPFLTTYDWNGNKIDSISFFGKTGEDFGYYAIEYLTLNKNKTISVVDTIKEWKVNEAGTDTIAGSLKIKTELTKYEILNDGRIISIKSDN